MNLTGDRADRTRSACWQFVGRRMLAAVSTGEPGRPHSAPLDPLRRSPMLRRCVQQTDWISRLLLLLRRRPLLLEWRYFPACLLPSLRLLVPSSLPRLSDVTGCVATPLVTSLRLADQSATSGQFIFLLRHAERQGYFYRLVYARGAHFGAGIRFADSDPHKGRPLSRCKRPAVNKPVTKKSWSLFTAHSIKFPS